MKRKPVQTAAPEMNLSAIACGAPRSGKSDLLRRRYLDRFPRILTVGITPEDFKLDPDCIPAFGRKEITTVLTDVARSRARKWHVVVSLEPDEVLWFLEVLVPRQRSIDQPSFGRSVNGFALVCHELKEWVPNPATRGIKRLYLQAGHHLISFAGATQYPSLVDRCATSSAGEIMTFATDEPNELRYWQQKFSAPIADLIATLPPRHFVYSRKGSGQVHLVDGTDRRDRVYRTLTRQGEEIAA